MNTDEVKELVEAILIIGARRANDSLVHDSAKELIKQHIDRISERVINLYAKAYAPVATEEVKKKIKVEAQRRGQKNQHKEVPQYWRGWINGFIAGGEFGYSLAAPVPGKEEVLLKALEIIDSPISHFQSELKEGEVLNGIWAVQLSNDANWLRGIAHKALQDYRELPTKQFNESLQQAAKESEAVVSMEDYNHAVEEIGQLQEQISDLQKQINDR